MDPANPTVDEKRRPLTRVDRSCARKARACTCNGQRHACVREVDLVARRLFSHEHPARCGEEGTTRRRRRTRGGLIRLDLVRHATCNVSLKTNTQSRGTPACAARRRPRWKSWKIVICTLVARSVSADDSSRNAQRRQRGEKRYGGG